MRFYVPSYHEHGLQDLKAMIDFVLEETKQKQLAYVGYSMGTTIGYVLLSQEPIYNEKVRVFYNFSPVVFWNKECKDMAQLMLHIYHPLKVRKKHNFFTSEFQILVKIILFLVEDFLYQDYLSKSFQ